MHFVHQGPVKTAAPLCGKKLFSKQWCWRRLSDVGIPWVWLIDVTIKHGKLSAGSCLTRTHKSITAMSCIIWYPVRESEAKPVQSCHHPIFTFYYMQFRKDFAFTPKAYKLWITYYRWWKLIWRGSWLAMMPRMGGGVARLAMVLVTPFNYIRMSVFRGKLLIKVQRMFGNGKLPGGILFCFRVSELRKHHWRWFCPFVCQPKEIHGDT